ncbi:MAG: nucleotidyltransferase domain-containing protein [Halanaerobiales bacterium]|nr:nucleotidyltransferase domain-containing protein [Halanaerobiales bacterium]
MRLTEDMLKQIEKKLKERNVSKASIFGSYARGDADDSSDIDLLVEPAKKSLFELAGIKIDLENALNKKFDVLTYNGLNYSRDTGFKERVLKEHMIII